MTEAALESVTRVVPWPPPGERYDVRHLAQQPLEASVRTRIAPAPSGDLHVGNVRTALYSRALARRHGGTFLLRVEDTDASRASDEAFAALQDVLSWAGLDWDEGPGVGGPHAPYRQSERAALYRAALARLLDSGAAYRAFDTPAELEAARAAAHAERRAPRYDGTRWKELDPERSAAKAAAGDPFVVRFAVPPGSTTWRDAVRGDVTIAHQEIPDFSLARSSGQPLYMLAAAVDDIVMGLTHVVRGEDLTTATPRQLMIYAALGVEAERWPTFGHLPLLVGTDGRPLSKRNGEVSLAWYRAQGFLPEALMNYLALLGWSLPGTDREFFSATEMVEAFSLDRVSSNPARFDVRKLEALNGDWIRALPAAELTRRLGPWVPGVAPQRLADAVPLIQERLPRLDAASDLLGFLSPTISLDDAARDVLAAPGALDVVGAAARALTALPTWTAPDIEAALRSELVERGGRKPKVAFGPVRVAVTGRRVSPPLFESLELLGREITLARLGEAPGLLESPTAPRG